MCLVSLFTNILTLLGSCLNLSPSESIKTLYLLLNLAYISICIIVISAIPSVLSYFKTDGYHILSTAAYTFTFMEVIIVITLLARNRMSKTFNSVILII